MGWELGTIDLPSLFCLLPSPIIPLLFSKPPPSWRPVLQRLLPQQRQSKYNDDTAVECTIAHALPTGMRNIDRNTAHNEISCVLSVWAIFHHLGCPYDSSYSYCINTVNYTKILQILHTWLSYIIILVDGIVGILFSSSLRCLFLLRMQPIFASHIFSTLQHGTWHSISAWG